VGLEETAVDLSRFDASDLRHFGGRSIADALVEWNHHIWYAKPCHGEPWREVFAWRLGQPWLNIAEVVYPDNVQGANWRGGRPFEEHGNASLVLVRIGQDYKSEELPIQDLDTAIATELVFSTWIRRRDAHPWNRTYISGLPIFFDHHIGFGAEAANLPIATFLRVGDDGGYAGRWRVRTLPASETPTTSGEREASGGRMAIHRIRDVARFPSLLHDAVSRIRQFDRFELTSLAKSSRVTQPEILVEFLAQTQDRLDDELAKLQAVLWKDTSL
jgi:hypothetical protein